MSDKLGMEGILYISSTPLTNSPSAANWSEVEPVRDLNMPMDKDKADLTSRRNDGWRAERGTLRNASIDFELIWDPDDPEIELIRDAYLTNGQLGMAIMDGDIATVGSQGFCANFEIMSFGRNEPLEEGMMISVTASPRSKHQWYTVLS